MYKFIKTIDPTNEYSVSNIEVTIEDNDVSLPTLLVVFQDFLSACSFKFRLDEHIDLVSEDDTETELNDNED